MANRSIGSVLGTIVLVLVVGVIAAPVQAQDEDDSTATDQEGVEEGQEAVLDTIVVTAQKREEDPMDIPISLSVLNTEQMEIISTGGADIRTLSGRVPSLVIESSFGRAFPRFYMRGLGNPDFDLNASQPVSMVYDEVVLENPVVKGMPLWDLERTEVLRGPQGSLFGRNTPAGVVKFDSKKPTQEKDAFARFSWGTYNTIDFRGAIGGRLSDTLSARFSLLYQGRSDWIDNDYTGEKSALGGYGTAGYRVQFLWEPNEKFSGLLNIHGWDVDGTARIFRENIMKPGTNQLVSSFSQDKVFHDGLNEQDISSLGGVLKLDYDFGNMTLVSVTGLESLDMFSRGDIDGGFGSDNPFAPPGTPPGGPIGPIPQESETADGIPDLDQFTQEFRLFNSDASRLGWLVGLYFFKEDLSAFTNNYNSLAPGNPQAGFASQQQENDAWALFGSLSYELSDNWRLQGGLRYSDDKKDFSAERPEPVFQTPTLEPITVSTDDSFVTWDLSATYFINEEWNVYGRVATGARAPSIQGRILFVPDFDFGMNPDTDGVSVADTESIISYEAGVKSELLDRRLRFNFSGYTWETDDQQLTIIGGAANVAELVNADKVEGYGFEAEAELMPTPRWLASLGLSYNKTKINDASLTVNGCALCTVTDPVAPNGEFSIDGNSLPHAPEWIFNGIIDYRLPRGEGGLFFGSLDWAYYSEKQFFLYESKEFSGDSFEVGLRLGYAFSEAKYEVAFYGRNIANAEILRGGIDFSNNTGFTNDPRILGVEFVARFW
ncbi:MAG: TonB-dependent receptor [Thermoanaerobaculia bacterium]